MMDFSNFSKDYRIAVLGTAISTTFIFSSVSPTYAATFDVSGTFEDGNVFSGTFELDTETGTLIDYEISTDRSFYSKSSEFFANARSSVTDLNGIFQIFLGAPIFPVGPRFADELYLLFLGSPVGFSGSELLTAGLSRESRFFEPGAGCDGGLGTEPGGCGPFFRFVTSGQATLQSTATVPESANTLGILSSAVMIGGALLVNRVGRKLAANKLSVN